MLATAIACALAAAAPAARDPFAAVVSADPVRCTAVANAAECAGLDDLTVTAVVTGTSTPRALVSVSGGQSVVLRVGDALAGGRIRSIRRDAVVIEHVAFSNLGPARRTLVTLPLGAPR